MKLRFHENSLRLRLSQSEVATLKESGRVENTVTFSPGHALVYSIEAGDVPELAASLVNGRVRVVLPKAVAQHWVDSNETGVEGTSSALKLLIEKDFQCLHPATEESEDSFPNPLAPQ